jgi:pimeloyl-ACP methyl ester carboxylesterase
MNIRRLIGRWAVIGIVLALLLPVPKSVHGQATVAGVTLDPASILSCEDGDQPNGSRYRICMPVTWNGGLVVYAHGYVAPNRPPGLPEDQLTLPDGTGVDVLATSMGYAFAASGYRVNGLAVQEGIDDLKELVDVFSGLKGKPDPILLVGVSEGGLIAALSAERHPEVYDGAMAMCGPIGDFQKQVEYFGDFRVVFDYFFPGLIPPSAVSVPPALLDAWESETYSNTVKPVVLDPTNAISVTQLFSVTKAPFDAANEATKEATIERLLWYSIYATNDAATKVGGNAFENATVNYEGSKDDAALNAGVARHSADDAALQTIEADYQTIGQIADPLVIMHTTGDPVIPAWHADLYMNRVVSATATVEYYPYTRYGHCNFTAFEIVVAFNRLAALERQVQDRTVYLPLLSRSE